MRIRSSSINTTSLPAGIRWKIVSVSSIRIGIRDSIPSVTIPWAMRSSISRAAGYFSFALSARARMASVSSSSRQGKIESLPTTGLVVLCDATSKKLSSSISSPKKSIRIGCSESGRKRSTIPPRTANSPRFSTKSVRVYDNCARCSTSEVRSTSPPISNVCRGCVAKLAMNLWIAARIGATTIGFFKFLDCSAESVAKRCATVSLRGLKRSCGRVSQAGNSKTLGWSSRSSFAKSSAPRLELVITRSGLFCARRANKNG